MNNNCAGCFADNGREEGCIALNERIAVNCPFFKTKEEYINEQTAYKNMLRKTKPNIYYHYYGKEGKRCLRTSINES